MKDTSKDVEKLYSSLLLKKAPEERLKMACSMFDLTCSIIKSSFPKDLPDSEIRECLFLRLYDSDLEEEAKKKVLQGMKNRKFSP